MLLERSSACTRINHASPFTLHPSPFTLHPSPFTLHPSPFTHRVSRSHGQLSAVYDDARHVSHVTHVTCHTTQPTLTQTSTRRCICRRRWGVAERWRGEGKAGAVQGGQWVGAEGSGGVEMWRQALKFNDSLEPCKFTTDQAQPHKIQRKRQR